MNITPITPTTPCFGIMCPQHAQCNRYSAVDGSQPGTQLGSCAEGREYPLFVAAESFSTKNQQNAGFLVEI